MDHSAASSGRRSQSFVWDPSFVDRHPGWPLRKSSTSVRSGWSLTKRNESKPSTPTARLFIVPGRSWRPSRSPIRRPIGRRWRWLSRIPGRHYRLDPDGAQKCEPRAVGLAKFEDAERADEIVIHDPERRHRPAHPGEHARLRGTVKHPVDAADSREIGLMADIPSTTFTPRRRSGSTLPRHGGSCRGRRPRAPQAPKAT